MSTKIIIFTLLILVCSGCCYTHCQGKDWSATRLAFLYNTDIQDVSVVAATNTVTASLRSCKVGPDQVALESVSKGIASGITSGLSK